MQHVQEDSLQKSGSSGKSGKPDRKSPDLIDFSSDIMDVFATSTTSSPSSNSIGKFMVKVKESPLLQKRVKQLAPSSKLCRYSYTT